MRKSGKSPKQTHPSFITGLRSLTVNMIQLTDNAGFRYQDSLGLRFPIVFTVCRECTLSFFVVCLLNIIERLDPGKVYVLPYMVVMLSNPID